MAIYRIPGFHLPLNNLPRVNRRAEPVFRQEIPDENILQYYSDCDLRARYRFGRAAIIYIVCLTEDKISPATNRSFPISTTNQVLITLRFLATSSFLQVTGDTITGAEKSTVSWFVRRWNFGYSSWTWCFHKIPSITTGEGHNQTRFLQPGRFFVRYWMCQRVPYQINSSITKRGQFCKQEGISQYKYTGDLWPQRFVYRISQSINAPHLSQHSAPCSSLSYQHRVLII